MKVAEFALEDRASRFQPLIDFCKKGRKREVREPRVKTRQHRDDHTATMGARLAFAGASPFADFGFTAYVPFAPVVGRLHVWVLHENK